MAKTKPFTHAYNFLLSQVPDQEPTVGPLAQLSQTKFGLTKRDNPTLDFEKLTKDKAKKIFADNQWKAVYGDQLPAHLAIALFDCAVDQGVGVALRLICKALGLALADAPKIAEQDPEVLSDPDLLQRFLALRLRRYAFSPGKETRMEEWAARVLALQIFLLTEAAEA